MGRNENLSFGERAKYIAAGALLIGMLWGGYSFYSHTFSPTSTYKVREGRFAEVIRNPQDALTTDTQAILLDYEGDGTPDEVVFPSGSRTPPYKSEIKWYQEKD